MKRGKLKRNIFILLLVLAALLTLTGCASAAEKDYLAAGKLLEQGEFEKAAEKFQTLGSYEDASRLLMLSRAALAAENGDYETARRAFSALGEFRDVPEMLRYYEGREAEAAGRSSLGSEDGGAEWKQLKNAAEIYANLPGFLDTAEREADCLSTLYGLGQTFLNNTRYSDAYDVFGMLGGFQDSTQLKDYSEACISEAKGANLEAAEQFSQIPDVLDAAARADSNRETVYQKALSLSEQGDQETAITLFSALGSYRDAKDQSIAKTQLLVQERLQRGDYEGVLFLMDAAPEAFSLQPADPADYQRFEDFLDQFVYAYLYFSANTSEDAVSGYYGVVPFMEQNSMLDKRLRQFLMIGNFSHNSNFNFHGGELLDLFRVDGDCYLAYYRSSASVLQPIGAVEENRTFRIMLRDSENGLIAGSIEDCLYGTENPTGRPVITGPLPNGELPPDEDGDGIIVVDIMKKGFKGTMIIVLDPSRVFAGGPGFYGGNGMLLEELVRRYDALGGINAGGFIDEDGGGTGGLPEGLTIVDGQSYLWAPSGASAAFDENDVLHVKYYTIETAAEDHIRDCVSFGPALISDGVAEYGPYMESGINPRTAIGQREDGAVLMLVIDGRQLRSIGASFGDLRDVMLDFGAVNACSLDGGSSTVMYLNGEYLNRPSSASGTSRYLPNAFLIRK
ncbi:MAG: phosphodiester glycosidase family protein [Oscillospiraceae bacterium]|nr:phosphodiester glycosidase family protein [Oscillospiraceae bacterium]